MTEIKFRAWDGKEMIPVYEMRWATDGTFLGALDPWFHKHAMAPPEKISLIVMQYTGLKDKNGVEIYEGDIVSYSTRVKEFGKVQHSSRQARFEVFWKFGDIDGMDEYWTSHELEVIGNIHQNPELLEKTQKEEE